MFLPEICIYKHRVYISHKGVSGLVALPYSDPIVIEICEKGFKAESCL